VGTAQPVDEYPPHRSGSSAGWYCWRDLPRDDLGLGRTAGYRCGLRRARNSKVSSQLLALSTTGMLEEPRSCLGPDRFRFDWNKTADDRPQQGRLCVLAVTDSSAQIGQITFGRAARSSPLSPIFQKKLNSLKVFIMSQTEAAAPDFPPVAAPTFTHAAVRFILSFAALIGLSLLLAGL
jgi:hypothetical protein